ncbi:unnamed protein product, partial [Iphiclides podalirius]
MRHASGFNYYYVAVRHHGKKAIFVEGSHRTPRDEEIRIHPFSPRGVGGARGRWAGGARGGKTDDAIPKSHYTSSGAVFYLGKEPAPSPLPPPPPPPPRLPATPTVRIPEFVYENCPLKWL